MKRMFLVVAVLLGAAASHARAEESYTFRSGPRLGVQITMLTDELRAFFGAQKDAGVLVGKIVPGSAADKAGVRVGDVLVSVGGITVGDADDVRQALSEHKEGDTVPAVVVRDRKPVTLAVRVPKAEPMPEAFAPPPDGTGFQFPREGMRMWKLSDVDKRLDAIEERLKKLEERK